MAAKLLNDLDSIQRFLQCQGSALGGAAVAVQSGQHSSFCARLASMSLSIEEASSVSSLISSGPWTDTERQRLLELVAGCLKGDTGSRRPNQTAQVFSPFLRQSDLNTLRSSASLATKMDLMACLMIKLGLVLPSEQTSGLVIRTLLALSPNEMPFHDCLTEFKRVFRLKTKGMKDALLYVQLPADPKDLPQEVYKWLGRSLNVQNTLCILFYILWCILSLLLISFLAKVWFL